MPQLLDLMHTLHTRAAVIFKSWAAEEAQKQQEVQAAGQEGGSAQEAAAAATQRPEHNTVDAGASTLWLKCWCPLLQGRNLKAEESVC
jgi:brefeldin A-resistance guanine nucleotide exchange factor 1